MSIEIFKNIDFYYYFYYFLIYSFLGWAWEVFYVYLHTKKVVNRGFLTGPVCPIYGFGASAIYISLEQFSQNIVAVFFCGMIIATILEYFTGTLMEYLFHAKWWDYSNKKFNLNGRICFQVSIGWGVFSVVLMKFIHPMVTNVVYSIPYEFGSILMYFIIAYLIVDTVYAANTAFSIEKALEKVEKAREDLREKIESTKLYEARNELLLRIEDSQDEFEQFLREKSTLIDAKYAYYHEDVIEKIGNISEKYPIIEKVSGQTENIIENIKENSYEFKEKLNSTTEELRIRHQQYIDLMNPTYSQKRLINAFPELKSNRHKQTLDRVKENIKNNSKKVGKNEKKN